MARTLVHKLNLYQPCCCCCRCHPLLSPIAVARCCCCYCYPLSPAATVTRCCWCHLLLLLLLQSAGDKMSFTIIRPGGLKSDPATGNAVATGVGAFFLWWCSLGFGP